MIACALIAALALMSQDSHSEDKAPSGFFHRGVDFWGLGEKLTEGTPKNDSPSYVESVWAEPTRLPDGRYGIYVPPPTVLAFLENPTEETLKGYLAWRRERAEKLSRAMALLAQHRKATHPQEALPPAEPSPGLKDDARPSPPLNASPQGTPGLKLIYFYHPKCPACVRQDAVLKGWLDTTTGITLTKITPKERPELWRRYRVTATPTLVLSAHGNERILVGLQSEAKLTTTLKALSKSVSQTTPERGKQP